MSALLDILSKFCCCKGSTSVDRERLLDGGRVDDGGGEYALPNGNGSTVYANSNRIATDRNMSAQTRSREEEEEDLMNKILDRTQQSIIDVSNLENSSLDVEVVQRSRLYTEAIKRHDTFFERRKGPLLDGATDVEVNGVTSALLANVGQHIQGLAAHPASRWSRQELELLSKTADLFLEAFQIGAQIECREELIVYMSLDD